MEPDKKLEQMKNITEPLLLWYDENRRILPWREDPTPYHVWLSEIMLQQTRVEAVKPYYARFLERIENIGALAEAEEEILLKLWEGLGYYSRIRNMQAAAKEIAARYGGQMPGTYAEILQLKGIGEYTAGAIASIAFGQPVSAVDGNVLRVLSRYLKDEEKITDQATKKKVKARLDQVIPTDRPGAFNQAMMDLGATVCTPNGMPHCELCPLREDCLACRDGEVLSYPKKDKKKARTVEELTVLVIRDKGKIAVHKRPSKGLLASLYEFPNLPGHLTQEEVLKELKELEILPIRIREIGESVHIFTHKEWHMKGYLIQADELTENQRAVKRCNWEYVDREDTRERYPIPSAFGAYVPYIL